VWAGRAAPRRLPIIRKLASDLGVDTRFISLGHVEDGDLAALYRHALALLFVSRCEGFGYPLVEAMASGCPVVSSGASSLGEVGGDATLDVDAESPAAVAHALGRLVHDDGERKRLATAGLARAQEFSLRRMAEGTREVYSQVLGHP
jgi:alpha-1,3-rhamnosyl/mannosyltransferase